MLTRENAISSIIAADPAQNFPVMASSDVELLINQIFDDFEAELEALQSRSCEWCKYLDKGTHGICPIAEPLMRQWLNYDEATFCCNRYEAKEQL